jgi:hypothetical protein
MRGVGAAFNRMVPQIAELPSGAALKIRVPPQQTRDRQLGSTRVLPLIFEDDPAAIRVV